MTFKLALVQAGLFAVSAVILFAAVYWGMVNYARTQLRSSIGAEFATLAEVRSTDGLADLIHTIDIKTRTGGPVGQGYLLRGSDGRRLAGTMTPREERVGWQDLASGHGLPGNQDDEPHSVEILGQRLASGELLMVGRDTRDIGDVEEQLIGSFGIAAASTLLLAVSSGVVTGLAALRRVDVINMTTRHIMQGDLNHRVPIRGTEDEFDRLAANLNEMLDRIQHLMEGLRQVSSDIAHDLRTPLTHLKQRLEAARGRDRSLEAYEAVIEATAEDTDRILAMFAALLRIAQIEAGTRRGGFGDLDLSAVFEGMLDVYGPVAEDNDQRLSGSIEPGLRMRGDKELLTQMLANLVENAIRYAGPGADISLSLRGGAGELQGVVADTGPGIPREARGIVFRRFFRLEPSRSSEGNGLGLSLVKAVVDLHDGRVAIADDSPGLRVEVALPAGIGERPHPDPTGRLIGL